MKKLALILIATFAFMLGFINHPNAQEDDCDCSDPQTGECIPCPFEE